MYILLLNHVDFSILLLICICLNNIVRKKVFSQRFTTHPPLKYAINANC